VGGSVRLTAGVGKGGEWFDPRTGARTRATPAGPLLYTAPDARDWVLVLR
jgi:hypothetical protein